MKKRRKLVLEKIEDLRFGKMMEKAQTGITVSEEEVFKALGVIKTRTTRNQ